MVTVSNLKASKSVHIEKMRKKLSQLQVYHRCFSAPHSSTCATPPNQPHLHLVCQSAPAFKLRTLTDPGPDCSLPYASHSSMFLSACLLPTLPVHSESRITCLLFISLFALLHSACSLLTLLVWIYLPRLSLRNSDNEPVPSCFW